MSEEKPSLNFLEEIVEKDLEQGTHSGKVLTRFPPEPNGYLHIGHAKSICLNFGLGSDYKGGTNLRFDDTNPVTEDTEYVESIQHDVQWLGFQWNNEPKYASDYFPWLYENALKLINKGLAYVDFSSAEEIAQQKGTPTVAGTPSVYRDKDLAWNLEEFEKMKNGVYNDGQCVLRAKIDLTSPNMHFRDPIIYRIKKEAHHRTGTTWCIYPMYDYAHCMSDSHEGITHSICTLEFEAHRPLYDWFLEKCEVYQSRQYEFARLNLNYTVMSKRKLLKLVQEKFVDGWDDPRMPTISGLRRRGYTPKSIREFCNRIGIARRENVIDVALLEFCIREDLNKIAPRYMAVTAPLKVTISNYPADKTETCEVENNPEMPETGHRQVTFSHQIFIEKDDFMETPPKGFHRLTVGSMVRLKGAYIIQCDQVVKDEAGEVVELICSYIPNSKSGSDTTEIKVKSVIHWLSVAHAVPAEVRFYDRLFSVENPDADETKSFIDFLNPDSLQIVQNAYVEPAVANLKEGENCQFLRKGYFTIDSKLSTSTHKIFNMTVGLKDSWKGGKK